MLMKKAKLFLAALSAMLTVSVSAQDITVTGTVTDASTGEGIPFASVIIKGTAQGVAADADGYYAIDAPADGTLEFSSIGYMTAEAAIDGKTFVNVSLEPDNEFIDVHKIPFDEALRMTRDGRITDVKTIIGLNWAEQYLQGKLEQAKEV